MEFGSSQVRESESVVKIEEDDPSGEFVVSDSVRASNITEGEAPAVVAVATTPEKEEDDDVPVEEQDEEMAKEEPEVEVPMEEHEEMQDTVPQEIVMDDGLSDRDMNSNPTVVKHNDTKGDDTCCTFRCCGFPNGGCQVLFALFFLAVGLMFCGWGMADCKFIDATAGYPDRYYPSYNYWWNDPNQDNSPSAAPSASPTMAPPPDKRRGFGFVFNETQQGGCGFADNGRYWHEEEFENYIDFLGNDWNVPRILGGTSLTIGWILWFAMLSMMCCSYVRPLRWLVGAIILLIISGFQASAFAVMGSSFCDEDGADCEPARGFWMVLAGILCYLITAGLFFMMSDYPGSLAY